MMIRLGNWFFQYRNIVFPFAILAVLLPSPRMMSNDAIALLLGGTLVLCGQALRVITIGLDYIVRGGKNRQVYARDLVTGGIFAHCRNPMYVGNILMVVGFGLALNSLLCFAVGGILSAFVYHAIVMAEENFLREIFGDTYGQYCRDVPRWRMRMAGLESTLRSSAFDWRRVVVKEYGTLFNSLAGLPLALCARRFLYGWGNPDWKGVTIFCLTWVGFVGVLYLTARYLKKVRGMKPGRPLSCSTHGTATS